jgi:hypothetical protein
VFCFPRLDFSGNEIDFLELKIKKSTEFHEILKMKWGEISYQVPKVLQKFQNGSPLFVVV